MTLYRKYKKNTFHFRKRCEVEAADCKSLIYNINSGVLERGRAVLWVSKSTHKRKFGNQVTSRLPFRPHHRHVFTLTLSS